MTIRGILYHHKGLEEFLISFLLTVFALIPCRAQTVIGTNGMMNVPTADMHPAGTFDGGASFIQKELLYEKDYNTFLYYISFTPFSWMEITLRETFLKHEKSPTDPKVGFYQQDRSTSVRLQPLKEGKYWPAVVVGSNDFYSDHGRSQYACVYGVASKHFLIDNIGTFEATIGYARHLKDGTTYDGVMGGLTFAPAFFPDLRVMGEYDTEGYNVGLSAFLFRHLNVTCFTREFKGFNATVSYQYTIKY